MRPPSHVGAPIGRRKEKTLEISKTEKVCLIILNMRAGSIDVACPSMTRLPSDINIIVASAVYSDLSASDTR